MKFRQKLKLGAMALLLLAAVAFGLFRWHLSRRVDRALAAIRADGYPVTLEELDAWYTEPPPGENAADILLEAFSLSQFLSPELGDAVMQLAQGKLAGRTEPLPEHARTLVTEYALANEVAFDLLYEAGNMREARWPIECRDGYATALPHLVLVRNCCLLLQMQALLHAEDGDPDAAFRALNASFGVVELLAGEPVYHSQKMRQECLRQCVAGLERVLNHTALAEKHLAALEARLESAEDTDSARRAIVGDRCMTIALVRPGPDTEPFDLSGRQGFVPPDSLKYRLLVTLAYTPSGLADHDLLKSIETTERLIQTFAMSPSEREEAMRRLPPLNAETHPLNLSHHMVWRAAQVMFESRRATAYLRAGRLALGVERYRLFHDSLPETVDALAPEYVDGLPPDPCSDGTIRYRRLPGGYVTYSLARNRQDDRGIESRDWHEAWQNGDLTFTVERE